jgi:hypothetical protein
MVQVAVRQTFLFVTAALVFTTGCEGVGTGAGEDASAQLACDKFYQVSSDADAGILTNAELRDGLQEVYDDARYSEIPEIRNSAQRMLAAITAGDFHGLERAVGDMDAACSQVEPL